jgi:predicted ATP-grasp superfamily ATP-dependent carboligase/peptidoglycan/xylan/chitin deacetylase (PgdA/CDA1 family)
MTIFNKGKLSQLPVIKELLWKLLPNGVYCFNYHRIGNPEKTPFDPNVFSCTAEMFEQHLHFYKKHFEIISTDYLPTLYSEKSLNKKYAVITFDDGYQDNYEFAYPLLKKLNIPATIYVATDFIDQKCIPWWDEVVWIIKSSSLQEIAKCSWLSESQLFSMSPAQQIKEILRIIKKDKNTPIQEKVAQLRLVSGKSIYIEQLDDKLFADWDMVREMANNGITIGSHTCSHRILSHLSDEEQEQELKMSKEKIEKELSRPTNTLAYPVGGFNSFTKTTEILAKAIGYELAFSYVNGINTTLTQETQYQLRRIPVDDNPNANDLLSFIFRANYTKGIKNNKNNVVVLGAGPNGLGVSRSFHLEGISVKLVTLSNKDISNFSRIPKEKHIITGTTNEEKHQWLLSFFKMQPKGTTIVPTSDWFVSFVTENMKVLEENCLFMLPKKEVTDILIDKALETKIIGDVVPLPKTIQEIIDQPQLLKELGLPIIIKPRSHKHMVLGQKNIILNTKSETQRFFDKFADKLDNLIAQQVILGEDNQQWVCNCVFDYDSNMVQAFTFNRLKLSPSHFGVTSYAISQHNEAVIELSKKIGKAIKFVGPAMVEFKKDPSDGEYKYIELNPRLGMCNFFDTSCGINNAYFTYLLASNKNIPEREPMKDNIVFLSFFEDFFSRRQDGEKIFEIFRDYLCNLSKKHIFIYFVWWDPYPAIHLAFKQLSGVIKSACTKLMNKVFK